MIRDDRKPVPDVLRQDIREWLLYLQDIGVRDLRLEGLASEGRVPVTEPSPEAVFVHPAPSPRPSAATPGPGLYVLDGDAPANPEEVLRKIREDLGDCTRCKLCLGRTHLVFGVGDPRARLMFVGEGPGADEDAKGEPFVGRAGKKLNEMIRAIGLERDQVYIANVVKCRPPDNRAPEPDEVTTCSPFLFRQIEAIRPRVLVALGAPAAKTLLGTKIGITALRGNWGSFRGIPVMPTFHPAYLLRAYTVENRRLVYDDLKAARSRMDDAP